jgi:transcriptional regulator with GAF, ATPase, and Fis domain
VEPSELAGLSQFQEDLDGFSDQTFQSLDILARALHVKNAELEPALQAIVSTAVRTLSSAQHAGLITVSRGVLVPQATTSRPPQLLDQLQQKLNDGPCINAAVQQALTRIDDMHQESRWPDFAAEAESLGVHSMLCVPLQVHEQCLGTLSLYLMERHRITADAAFGYLSQASQTVNMKLTAVARHLVETGELLSVPSPGR